MIEYWSQYQGIELNKQVASLFCNTRQKFSDHLLNKINNKLYLDLLDNNNKKKLFSIVLIELEILILDIIELDLNIESIKLLNYKILYDLIQKSLRRFLSKTIYENINLTKCNSNYLKVIFTEHRLLLEYILIYLVYGTSQITSNIFIFDQNNTPRNHVSVLFENLIIQISDSVICVLLEKIESLCNITAFINNYSLCNSAYVSIRSVALFRNTLVLQNFIRLYLSQPKAIYSSRYKVWLISSNGLIAKYIYTSRVDDIYTLSTFQLSLLFLIEIVDIVIPHLEKFLLVLSKIFLYILINILGNTAIFCIRSVVVGINNIHR